MSSCKAVRETLVFYPFYRWGIWGWQYSIAVTTISYLLRNAARNHTTLITNSLLCTPVKISDHDTLRLKIGKLKCILSQWEFRPKGDSVRDARDSACCRIENGIKGTHKATRVGMPALIHLSNLFQKALEFFWMFTLFYHTHWQDAFTSCVAMMPELDCVSSSSVLCLSVCCNKSLIWTELWVLNNWSWWFWMFPTRVL